MLTPDDLPNATVEPVRFVGDSRGLVVEPLAPHEIPAQRNVHLALTEPGEIRGNHYHERGTEVAVVVGPALVRVREGDGTRDVEVPEGLPYRFIFPPRVSHAFLNTGDAPMVIVSFNTERHDPAAPDVVRDVLLTSADL